MKEYIKRLLQFIPFLIGTYLLLICIWGDIAPRVLKKNLYTFGDRGHTYTTLNDVKNTNNVDILFLGSSHAYRSFDTRIFDKHGFKAFNLGTNAQTPVQTHVLLYRYLEKLNPKIIIFEVCPGVFCSDGIESSCDIIANDTIDFLSVEMAIKNYHLKVFNSLVYGIYRDFFNRNKGFKVKPIKDDTYVKGGFVARDLNYTNKEVHTETNLGFNPLQFIAFEKIVSLIKSKRIELILVQAPVTKALYKSYSNINEFNNKISHYGVYYNFNGMIELDDTLHFYNPEHLNQYGAAIFSRKLMDFLFYEKGISRFKATVN